MVEEGKPAPDFELTSDSGETVRLSDSPRQAGRSLLLSQGRHTRVHDAGVRDPRLLRRVRASAARSSSASAPTRRRRTSSSRRSTGCRSRSSPTPTTGRRGVRHLGREELLRQEVHGRRALDVPHRQRGAGREGDAPREARHARRPRCSRRCPTSRRVFFFGFGFGFVLNVRVLAERRAGGVPGNDAEVVRRARVEPGEARADGLLLHRRRQARSTASARRYGVVRPYSKR